MNLYLFKSILSKIAAPVLLLLMTFTTYAQPCQTITVSMTSTTPAGMGGDGNIIRVCQNSTVSFVATATFSTSSAGAIYIWTYGDGTGPDTTNSLVASHTYPDGGVYIVDLLAVDPQGCRNSNRLGQVVQVSTTPLFTGTQSNADSICAHTMTMIHGQATPVPGIYDCAPPVADTTFLPDGTGVSYSTSINVECFAFGTTITSGSQIQSICLTMEHSFLGDLDWKIICPNGQQTIIKQFPGSGGTYLGEPFDTGQPNDNSPGVGYQYCFSGSAAWGTIVAEDALGNHVLNVGVPASVSMTPGTYQPFQSYNNLIGCPLNGNWTIQITDNQGIDNGFIFNWGINFDPALLPGSYSFTPTFTTQGWNSNPDIVSTANGGHDIFILPHTGGLKTFNYQVTDNFGCTYDTSISVYVKDPGNPGLDTAIKLCLNQGPINAFESLGGNPQPGGTWSGTGVTPGGQFDPATTGVGVFDIVYTKATDDCDTTATITVTVVNDVVMDFDFAVTKGCTEDVVQFTNLSQPGTYQWKYGDGTLPFDTVTNPTHIYENQAVYPVQLRVRNLDGCLDSITKLVDVTHPLNAAFTSSADTVCLSEGVVVNFTNGSVGATGWNWTFGEGTPANTQDASHVFTQPGLHSIRLIIHDDIPCYDTAYDQVQVDSVPYFSIAQDKYAICAGEQLNLTTDFYATTIRSISWNFGDGSQWYQTGATSHHYDNPGVYWINADADFGICGISHVTDSIVVNAYPVINLGPDSVLCLDAPAITVADLNNAGDPTIQWYWNTGATTPSIQITAPGTYSLTASKGDCATTENIEVNKDCYADIPNVFTPNGDGVNDYFFPRQLLSKGVVGFSMTVFDRWGQKIFETTSSNGRGWDGKFNDKEQPMGVYIYQMTVALKNGRTENFNGNVTLVR